MKYHYIHSVDNKFDNKDENGLISDCLPGHSLKYPGISSTRGVVRMRVDIL